MSNVRFTVEFDAGVDLYGKDLYTEFKQLSDSLRSLLQAEDLKLRTYNMEQVTICQP